MAGEVNETGCRLNKFRWWQDHMITISHDRCLFCLILITKSHWFGTFPTPFCISSGTHTSIMTTLMPNTIVGQTNQIAFITKVKRENITNTRMIYSYINTIIACSIFILFVYTNKNKKIFPFSYNWLYDNDNEVPQDID